MISEQEQKKEFYEKMLKRADNILTIKDVTANSANISRYALETSVLRWFSYVPGYTVRTSIV